MTLAATVKFLLGWKICPVCGSTDIIVRGFSGVNQRYHCKTCNRETGI